jgi:hypothetical protein
MKRIILSAALALAVTLPAHAQNGTLTRSFVSSTGVDTNPCTITQPCGTFAVAYTKISANGIIAALDPGKYGPLTGTSAITSGVTINGNGWAAITAPANGNGITINAGTGDVVLIGIEIDGAKTANNGIMLNSANSLTVTNCFIWQMASYGIDFASTTASTLTVSNSILNDNVAAGVLVQPTGNATATFDRVQANNNKFDGILVSGMNSPSSATVNATAFESVASGNGNIGFYAYSGGSTNAPTTLMVSHSAATNNGYGAEAEYAGATIYLANSTLSGNTNGWAVTGAGGLGVVESYGDNYIDGNAANEAAPPSVGRK